MEVGVGVLEQGVRGDSRVSFLGDWWGICVTD